MHSIQQCGLIQHQVRPIGFTRPTCTPMHNRTGTTVANLFRISIVIIHMAPITSLTATIYCSMVLTKTALHTTVFRKDPVHITITKCHLVITSKFLTMLI